MSQFDVTPAEDSTADEILFGVLSLTRWHFPRYRRIFLDSDGSNVLILALAGGENRPQFEEFWNAVRRFPQYTRDYDDSSDSNFAWIVFAVPEDKLVVTRALATGEAPAGPPFTKCGP